MVLEAVDSRLRDVFAAFPSMACIVTRNDAAPVVELSTGNARPDILVEVTEDGPEMPSLLCVSWLGHEVLAQCERADVACGIVGAMLAHDLGLPATCAKHGDNLPCPGCSTDVAPITRVDGGPCEGGEVDGPRCLNAAEVVLGDGSYVCGVCAKGKPAAFDDDDDDDLDHDIGSRDRADYEEAQSNIRNGMEPNEEGIPDGVRTMMGQILDGGVA